MMKSNQQLPLTLRICLKISPESLNQLIKSNTADPASAVAAVQGIAVDKKSGKEETTTPRKVLYEFAQDMLEEIIIYPSLICNLYAFVNERG